MGKRVKGMEIRGNKGLKNRVVFKPEHKKQVSQGLLKRP